jgi:N-methylhydantoinase B/oxoprolinase/acetone carboxylase alpha subunit
MKSFGRHWDETDNQEMESTLQRLVLQYGKKNVMAVLNTLRGDADNYSKHKVNQIDTEINRYSKSLDNLLK